MKSTTKRKSAKAADQAARRARWIAAGGCQVCGAPAATRTITAADGSVVSAKQLTRCPKHLG
jgi:hypothetical protein